MHVHRATLPDLADHASDTARDEIDPDGAARLTASRASLVDDLGLLKKGALAGGVGALLAAVIAGPAAADKKLDVQILQTASSLEILAVATYGAALSLPFIKNGNAVVKKFAQTTRMQHDEHNQAFQAQTKALGGKKQKKPNPKYAKIVKEMTPSLKTPSDVVTLAATLETVATETYLNDLAQFSDTTSKELMASVMGVESQHLATLRAVGALLDGGAEDLIAIPTDVAALPAAAGSVAFPEAFEPVTMASPAAGRCSEMTEPRDLNFSRRGFLAAAGATAAAAGVLVTTSGSGAGAATLRAKAGAAVPAGLPGRVGSQSASDDLEIAMFAASLEVVAVNAYQAVLDGATNGSLGAVPPAGAEFAQTAHTQHQAQLDAWNEVITGAGQPAVTAPDPGAQGLLDLQLPRVTDFASAAMLARTFEEIAAATYLAAIPKLSDDDAIQLAGSIQIIDMQHVAILNFVLGDYPVPDVFAKAAKAPAS